MKKSLYLVLAVSLSMLALAACGNKDDQGADIDAPEGATVIEFWAAANPLQESFWNKVADEFNNSQDEIHVAVSQMRETPTSEATVQSALASDSAPTMSENINRGFASQLANSQALVPLNELDGWDDILTERNMTETVEAWEFADGNQYVLPIYSNSMQFGWRIDILKELGFEEAPRTYSEVYEVVDALKEEYPDKFLWAKSELASPDAGARWFDFFTLYAAASNGNNFIEGDSLISDDDAGQQVLEFLSNVQEQNGLLTNEASDPFETGLSIFADLGPWTFPYWAEQFPEMVYGETFVLTPPPVPDDMDTDEVNTFADSKGIVIYASATEEEQRAAMEFITWVYNNPEMDLQWFEETNMPPARDDLGTNEQFQTFLEDHPELVQYAEAVPYGVPPIDNPDFNTLQTFIGQEALNPVVTGAKDPKTAWEDMKRAIEGALQ
ncbi:sugar ABC transporter substrate-binding protein [Bacillus sp. J14TS2]|uniref:ABC transporter substrate-binding protein n=1 Tax=Bacillus sp. J14TS2 TaxID=2807188 RepID=UPI001B265DAD|nr:ABC transporter substrate-binding protein [Bacillus sp. J14TS2]GIN73323.1 sugar ABC transporter substrate-binding protein [Bacillus sp. J14TS2]